MVHAGGDRGLAGRAAHHPGWATLLLRSGDRHGPDAARRVPLGAAPDRGADRLRPATAWPRSPGSGSQHPEQPGRDAGGVATRRGAAPVHLLVDSTGLKLYGAGEWLAEKHGTKRRRAWKVLHLATDANTGRIVASVLTDKDADDGSQVGPLLDQVDGSVASVTGDGAYDRDDVYAEVAARHPAAAVV